MKKKYTGKILLLFSITIITINAIAKDKTLLRITFIVYLILLIYKLVSFFIPFLKYYDKKATIKFNFLSFLKGKNPVFYNILEQESIILNYGFLVWRKKVLSNDYFNSYEKNPNVVIYYAFIFLILMESVLVDFLLIKFSFHVFARIAILSSLYLIIVFVSHVKALKYRHSHISNENLIVRYGIMSELIIPYSLIQNEKVTNEKTNIIPIGLLSKMEKHNVIIHFKKPISVERIYGIKKTGDGVSFHISNIDKFNKLLNEKIDCINKLVLC